MVCATLLLAYPKQPCVCLKVNMLRSQKVDSAFSYFLILIFIFQFLELRVRVSNNITQSHDTVTATSHMMHGRT